MSGTREKGSFSADIPDAVLEEALKSVARHGGEPEPPPVEEPTVEVEPPGPDLAAELDRVQAELAAEHDRLLRVSADHDNFRKRVAREREESARMAAGPVVRDLLPAVDNLERALAAAPADDPLSSGVRMVLRQIEDGLARHGIEPRDALGQPFDPSLHEALATVPSADVEAGTVVAQQGRAWMHHGRLLRPAQVAVAAPVTEGEGSGG